MTALVLTEEQGVVLTVLGDLAGRGEGPVPAKQIARLTARPGERTYGVARTRRVLMELRCLGLTRRTASASGTSVVITCCAAVSEAPVRAARRHEPPQSSLSHIAADGQVAPG
jgi:hypothetical protein